MRFDYNYSPAGLPANTYGYSRSDYAAPKTYLIAYHVPDSAVYGARRHGNTLRFNPDFPGRAMSIGMNADAPVFLSVNSNLNIAIAHAYDGLGRLVQTTRTVSSTPTEFHHVRDGLKVVGNIDYTNSQTAPTWTNKPNGLMPIESQQLQTNSSQQYINISDKATPARVTYHPTTSAAGNTSTVCGVTLRIIRAKPDWLKKAPIIRFCGLGLMVSGTLTLRESHLYVKIG